MTVRAASEQSIPEELVQRIGDLTARFAELNECVRRVTSAAEGAGLNDAENFARPIEFLTENSFAIVRQWEADGSPAPADGRFCFLVRDQEGAECEVKTEIANGLIADTAFHTRGRIQLSSSFWICCAERHLAGFVWEHDGFPDGDRLLVETLDPDEVILATRWDDSDEERNF